MCIEFHWFCLLVSAPLLLSGIVVADNVNAAVIHCVIVSTLIALITSKYCYSNKLATDSQSLGIFPESSLMLNLNF